MSYDDKHKTNRCNGYVKGGRKLVKNGLTEKEVFKKKYEGGKEVNHVDMRRRAFQTREVQISWG